MVMSNVRDYGGNQRLDDAPTVARFFDAAPQQYHAKGVEHTFADIRDVDWMTPDLAFVRAHFPYIDAEGNDLGDGETSVYVVRKNDDGFSIDTAITLGVDSERK